MNFIQTEILIKQKRLEKWIFKKMHDPQRIIFILIYVI